MKSTKQQHEPGKIQKLWPYLVELHAKRPDLFASEGLLKGALTLVWPGLKDHTKCANCGESMAIYAVRLDWHNAALLAAMGQVFLENFKKGKPFSEANKIHVVSTNVGDATRHRTTQCRTLGLIAKVKNENGKHDRDKGWLITERGFKALRGEAVPSAVSVFRNRIEERGDSMITLQEVLLTKKDREYTHDAMQYVEIAGLKDGAML